MSQESSLHPLIVGYGEYEKNIPVPIIVGGMSIGITGARMCKAASECGGIGTIGGVGRGFGIEKYSHLGIHEADCTALADELQLAREMNPQGIIAVNLLVAVSHYDRLVRTAAENGANIVVSGAGLPFELPELTVDHPEVALIPIVSSVQAAGLVIKRWQRRHQKIPDAIVIEEPATAGGHLGVTPKQGIDNQQLKLDFVLPELRNWMEKEKLNIPLIAAGGIWDRADINRVLKLGASGVQMATRFVTTEECDAPQKFKQKYLDSKPEDIVIIQSPVGIPGRAIKTKFLEQIDRGEIEDVCQARCLRSCVCCDSGEKYCIIQALANSRRGDVENGIVFSGSNAPRSKEQGIVSVSKIFEELTA